MSSQQAVFAQRYAEVYDLLYRTKDYDLECDFIESLIRKYHPQKQANTILDLGCGTGGHAIRLGERGYKVHGVDISENMLENARRKAEERSVESLVSFQCSNIQDYGLNRSFDLAICMFAVLGYQVKNDEVLKTLMTARQHLNPNGIFIADFWYGPAVLSDRPAERVRTLDDGSKKIIRLTKPVLETEQNVTTVNFHVLELVEDILRNEVHESHRMRYFFCPELEFFARQAGFESIEFCAFLEPDTRLHEQCWNACMIAR